MKSSIPSQWYSHKNSGGMWTIDFHYFLSLFLSSFGITHTHTQNQNQNFDSSENGLITRPLPKGNLLCGGASTTRERRGESEHLHTFFQKKGQLHTHTQHIISDTHQHRKSFFVLHVINSLNLLSKMMRGGQLSKTSSYYDEGVTN